MISMDKTKLWLIEVIIWGIIVFTIVSTVTFVRNNDIRKNYTYFAFFKDVDGIIVGSPVKIQGVQVGYVSDMKLVNDEVFVTFIITDNNFKMPSKMNASVSFTGMGGSKSIELFVPKEGDKAKDYIRTIEPMRIKDFMYYSNETSQILLSMMNDAMEMMNDNTVKIVKEFIHSPKQLDDIENMLENVQRDEDNFMKKRGYNANRDE